MDGRNVFLYWTGKEYKLINILRNLIYLHSYSGKGYNVHLITDDNINTYIPSIHPSFSSLCPAHKADFVRVYMVNNYGGIWLDSDTLVMDSLDSLFDMIDKGNGFFILENNNTICNGVFGSKPHTPLIEEWFSRMIQCLDRSDGNLQWTQIGGQILMNIFTTDRSKYRGYSLIKGLDTVYPVNWNICLTEYITKPYDNYKTLVRSYQPFLILVNSVYKAVEPRSVSEIFNGSFALSYFLKRSIQNLNLSNYEFIEIGTSNFDTLIESANDDTKGLTVECVSYYLNSLPTRKNVIKINKAVSNKAGTLDIYYIPEDIIRANDLPDWFRGCNSVMDYHPLHKKHKVTHLCKIDTVETITPVELFQKNKVGSLSFLKIDTEGHDCIILDCLCTYLQYLPQHLYPKKIQFESNENLPSTCVETTISKYKTLGYSVISRGLDTLLTLSDSASTITHL